MFTASLDNQILVNVFGVFYIAYILTAQSDTYTTTRELLYSVPLGAGARRTAFRLLDKQELTGVFRSGSYTE